MERAEFIHINNKPCRIKMRSGKEVYGVIWEKSSGNYAQYFFASLAERFHRRMASATAANSEIGMLIDLNDVAGAEPLDDSATLVG